MKIYKLANANQIILTLIFVSSPVSIFQRKALLDIYFLHVILNSEKVVMNCLFQMTIGGKDKMASSRGYLEFVLDQLSGLEDISYKAMMGEFIIYYRGRIVGGIYDDRFLVKPVEAAKQMMPEAPLEIPYEGAKEMLLVDDVDNRSFLCSLLDAMFEELPAPKKKK